MFSETLKIRGFSGVKGLGQAVIENAIAGVRLKNRGNISSNPWPTCITGYNIESKRYNLLVALYVYIYIKKLNKLFIVYNVYKMCGINLCLHLLSFVFHNEFLITVSSIRSVCNAPEHPDLLYKNVTEILLYAFVTDFFNTFSHGTI